MGEKLLGEGTSEGEGRGARGRDSGRGSARRG